MRRHDKICTRSTGIGARDRHRGNYVTKGCKWEAGKQCVDLLAGVFAESCNRWQQYSWRAPCHKQRCREVRPRYN